jgi:AhpD family alkylhydroperoxidase
VTTPRISPGGRREVGLVTWLLSQGAGLVAGTAPPNIFLTLGRHRRLFRGWLHFAGRLMPGGRLPRRETELVILRVAYLRRCPYEFDHHVHLARRAGVDDGDVARVMEGPTAPRWSARERAILAVVDALHHGDVDDETWDAMRGHLSERDAIELCLLAGHYEMLASTINALRIEPEARRRGRLARA